MTSTYSEVTLCVEAYEQLAAEGIKARVVARARDAGLHIFVQPLFTPPLGKAPSQKTSAYARPRCGWAC